MTAATADQRARAAGLTGEQAAAILGRDGPNRLPAGKRPAAWRQVAGQMFHFFALMLWAAGALALVAGMPQLGIAIFVVVIVNGLFAFVQESRAERAAERLRDLLPRRATVVRDGARVEVDADELVVGDLVLLGSGDRVSADLQLVEADGVAIDTSLLTGESVPTQVAIGDPVLAGTFLVEGDASALVTATGDHTRLASIAKLTTTGPRPRTPLAIELDRVVRTVAVIAVGVGAAFFAISLGVGAPASDGARRRRRKSVRTARR
jgi:magnesium-transporting ATPase (P-type)